MPGQKSFMGNKHPGFYMDKYCMFTYVTPTFITKVHCLVTRVQLLLTTVKVN